MCVKDCYDHLRVTQNEHVRSICNDQVPIVKTKNVRKLLKLYDMCKQFIKAIELSDLYNLDTILTIAMEVKMGEVTRLRWVEYSNDFQKRPLYFELLEFLDSQVQHFESVSFD